MATSESKVDLRALVQATYDSLADPAKKIASSVQEVLDAFAEELNVPPDPLSDYTSDDIADTLKGVKPRAFVKKLSAELSKFVKSDYKGREFNSEIKELKKSLFALQLKQLPTGTSRNVFAARPLGISRSYSTDQVLDMIASGESSLLDFKEVKIVKKDSKSRKKFQAPVVETKTDHAPHIQDIDIHTESLTKWISQFANSELGGVLLFGVSDAAKLVGVPSDYVELLGTKIRNAAEACNPSVQLSMCTLILPTTPTTSTTNTCNVVAVDIPPSKSLHESSQGYYIRNGNGALKLDGDALKQIIGDKSVSLSSADHKGVDATSYTDCDATLLLKLSISTELDIPDQLVALGLARNRADGCQLTVAGVLLTCANPQLHLPCAKIVCTQFSGKHADKNSVINAVECAGTAAEQIDSAVSFVLDHQMTALKEVKETDCRRFPAFSTEAVFEIIVNAVVHRDYSLANTPIHLRLFSNRLELMVPGTLLHPVTTLSLGKAIIATNRNFSICRFLSTLISAKWQRRYCEERGFGVMKALKSTQKLHVDTDNARGSSSTESDLVYTTPDPYHLLVTLRAQDSPHSSPSTSPNVSPTK